MTDFSHFLGDQAQAETDFEKVPTNYGKLRAARIAKNLKALEAMEQSEPARGRSEIKVANGIVRFSPSPLVIRGAGTVYVPLSKFAEFIGALNVAIEAGEMDAELSGEPVPAKPEASGPQINAEAKKKSGDAEKTASVLIKARRKLGAAHPA
jgi:hypothetical protein